MDDGGDAFEVGEGVRGGGAGEGLEEGDVGGGLGARGVEALDAEGHFCFSVFSGEVVKGVV